MQIRTGGILAHSAINWIVLWFGHGLRFPFLREGDTPEKHHAVDAFLREREYKAAEVTLNFGDYAYNEPYARCLARNDVQAINWLKQSHLSGASESLSVGQKVSNQICGRDIKHVMLLHIGVLETVMLPRLLELLKQRGFELITLQEAESDPEYAHDPDLPSRWDGTFLRQMMVGKRMTERYQLVNPLVRLDQLCQ